MSNYCFCDAKPKSPILYIFNYLPTPCPTRMLDINIFYGFKSLWAMPISCIYSNPLAIQYNTLIHYFYFSLLPRSYSSNVPPWHIYITIYICLSVRNTSYCLTKNGHGSNIIFLLNFLITEISLNNITFISY